MVLRRSRAMTVLLWVGGGLSALLFAYLFVALLAPERLS
jgi:K+-transporting ATPase KdpF subunit